MVRLRHRYIVAKVRQEEEWKGSKSLTRSDSFLKALTQCIRLLHGIHGVALSKAGLFVKYIKTETKIIFLRMRRSAYKIVSSALPFMSYLDGQQISIQTLYTGATIRHCNIFLRQYHKRELEGKYGSLKTEMERALFAQELKTMRPISI